MSFRQGFVGIGCGLLLLAGAAPALAAPFSPVESAPHIEAQLLSEPETVAPGEPFAVALRLLPEDHWHTYWENPGDSGLGTRLTWSLPEGAAAGPIQWPAPRRLPVEHLVNYGFEGETWLLTEVTPPADLPPGDTFAFDARADWLVCKEICIPGSAEFTLTLPVAESARPFAPHAAPFAAVRERLPRAVEWPTRFEIADGQLKVRIEAAPEAVAGAREITLFPAQIDLVDHAAPQVVNAADGVIELRQALNTYFTSAPDGFGAILLIDRGDGARGYRVHASLADGPLPPFAGSGIGAPVGGAMTLLPALALALVGGLILNLMPCVFPILSLKALALARAADHGRREQALHGLIYTGGVLVTFAAIAALLLSLRAGGAAVGWGFQLQNPWVVGALAYLMFTLGLAFSGVVQFGGRWMGLGSTLAAGGGFKGSFFTGMLAVVVASPCTAPFMGAALGFAVTQPPVTSMAVFLALGLGMALPFLLLGFAPGLGRRLPKPGPWMESFKQWMAFPLYLTAVWLLWVLGRQSGADGMAAALLGLVALAAALWLWGRGQARGSHTVTGTTAAAALVAAAILALGIPASSEPDRGSGAAADWEPWSEAREQELRAEGRPLFVNMTADWCITCLANEQVALETERVREAFARHGITYLKGDWTRRDGAITDYLARFGRNGVPLYVLYGPGAEPELLPQLLTPALVVEAVRRVAPEITPSTQGE